MRYYKFLLTTVVLYAAPLLAQETWNVDAAGNWGTAANWSPAIVPNAVDATATFGNKITAPRTVTLDISPTVGGISFDNASAYTISPSSTHLTMSVSSGSAAVNITNVNGNGAHSITAPITLSSNLTVTHSSTATFTLSGAISSTGSLTKTGLGTLVLQGSPNSYTGNTIINSGVVQASADNQLGDVNLLLLCN